MKQNFTCKKGFKISCAFLLLTLFFGVSLQAQNITGTISDTQGPLPGTSVVVKGTTLGTTSDFDGNYSIDAPTDATTLVFSYVGYSMQEVPIDGKTKIDVTMTEDAQALSEVVVVGYGTQRKADLTGAVGSVSAADIIKQPIVSPDQVLAGSISGVNITNRSGDPGAPISVNIRGIGTLSADSNPLYVIDGVPLVGTNNITVNTSSTTDSNPLASISPNDIESMDVLKDAASAAIYGARGANGVIIITTKKGSAGDPKVTYDGYTSTASARETLDVLNTEQYIAIQNELGRDFSQFSGEPTIDWQDAIFKNGFIQNHNVGVSGGGENGTYYISGSYLDNEGIQRAQSFTRYSLRANSEIKIGKRLKFGESLQISQTDRLTQSEGAINAGFGAAQNAPFFKILGDGPLGYNPSNPETRGDASGTSNLVQLLDERINSTTIQNRKVLGYFYGELEIIDNLKLRPSIGIDYNVGSGDFFQAETTLDGGLSTRQSLLVQSRPIEFTLTTGATLTYDKTFGDHNFGVLVGVEQTKFRYNKVRLQGRNLFNDNFAASGTTVAGANEADLWTLQGIMGRLTYNYNGKYLMTANIRRDATSRFAEGFRDDVFPSISVGWRISQEDFMSDVDFIDDLKIRAGYGELGNQNIGDGISFPYLSALNNNIFYIIGDGQEVTVAPAPTAFANQALRWETAKQIDIGLDFSFLNGKITGVFDYYKKTNEDALLGLPIPFSSGFFLPAPTNAGEIENTGIELALNYKNKIGDFEYGIGANFTTVKNTVTSLGPVSQIITGVGGAQSHRTIVGESLGHFYGYKTDGLYQNAGDVALALPDANSPDGPEPGDIRFIDVSGPDGVPDGKVDADDRTFLGSPYPGFFYGINLQAAYKGFDFSVLFRGVGDRQIYNSSRVSLEGLTGTNNFSTQVLNRWTGEGTTNSSSSPRLAIGDPNRNNRISDRFIEDADYLRIQNIQLGYTLPQEKLQSWTGDFVSNMRFYLSVQNLATFTGYSGYDPEVGRAQSFQKGNFPLATGQDGGSAPLPRVVQLGWSVSFK